MAEEGWEEMGKGYVPWSSGNNAGWDWPQLLQTGLTVSQHKWHPRVAFVLDEQLCHLSESIDYTTAEWIKYFSKFIKKLRMSPKLTQGRHIYMAQTSKVCKNWTISNKKKNEIRDSCGLVSTHIFLLSSWWWPASWWWAYYRDQEHAPHIGVATELLLLLMYFILTKYKLHWHCDFGIFLSSC